MGSYQRFRAKNSEQKLFYLVDQLIGGVNTEFSDDTSPDNEFYRIINFDMDRRGSLHKRKGFGKLNAVSEIFNLYPDIPTVRGKTPEDPNPEETNDNLVYVKMLKNDNNCFRNLSAYTGEKAYRDYQRVYGGQNNQFELLIITTNLYANTSTAWLYKCELPKLKYDENNRELDEDTIITTSQIYDLPVVFTWDRNLTNIDTVEFFNKIYFTSNNKGLVCFDRDTDTFSYIGNDIEGVDNSAYIPSPMEIRKVGFNILTKDPLHSVDYQGLTTDSIQGVYITSTDNKPLTVIPSGSKFRLNILYTGDDDNFTITFKEGETELSHNLMSNFSLSSTGLKVYDVTFTTSPTSTVEIKIEKTGSNIQPYYDYYDVGSIDQEIKAIEPLNIGDYGMCEMYNRLVFYKDDTIWFSELNNFSYIPNYNYVSLPIEPTDKITKIVFFRNVYIIFTKNRIYKMLNSFGDSGFEVMPVNLTIGCHAPNTVIPVENELYFASTRGLYALKSSEYREGIENLRELDTKVKSLTSDMTLYEHDRDYSSLRYNGISSKAYAIRYKDKYMLFFNTAYELTDVASAQDIDALVYQYELKVFSEIKFTIKPTFLFMVDNAIETFATVKEKEEYTKEEVLLEYNFGDLKSSDKTIKDLSGNNNDAIISDGLIASPGIGVSLDGNNTSIKTGVINQTLSNGFKINSKCSIDELTNSPKLYSLKQSTASGGATPQTFSLYTSWSNGYRCELICVTSPNVETKLDTIKWTLRLHRDSLSRNGAQSGNFWLKDIDDNYLISDRKFSFNMSELYQDVDNGTFEVQHNDLGEYSENWQFSASTYYPTSYNYWSKGNGYSFDQTQSANEKAGYKYRVWGTVEPYDGGCNVNYNIQFIMERTYALYVGARDLTIYVNGVARTHSMGSISNSASSQTVIDVGSGTVPINYTGSPSIGVNIVHNIRATISGTYRENFTTSGFNLTLPSMVLNQGTSWNSFSMTFNSLIELNKILKPSYREISLSVVDANNITLTCNSEYSDNSSTLTNTLINVFGEHKWSIDYTISGEDLVIKVLVDDITFGTTTFPSNSLVDGTRNGSTLFDNIIGTINNFSIVDDNNSVVLNYMINEGDGTSILDTSGNGIDGTIEGNNTWVVEEGVMFTGTKGYITLPEFDSDVRFSNGYSIEFDAKIDDLAQVSKILNLSSLIDTTNNSKCVISVGLDKGNLSFNTISSTGKKYNLETINKIDSARHKWKFSIVDNGTNYDTYLYCDGELRKQESSSYSVITNVKRKHNYIGKSTNSNDSLFSGILYNFKITVNASADAVPIYKSAIYEYDTAYGDFDRDMDIELQTKGMNLQYPMHIKKLKNIFVKGLGGYNYNELFFELYQDGHLVNDPKIYECYIDETTRQVVYEYTGLDFDERSSILGSMRLNHTELGNSTYELRKLVIPSKGKNFTVRIYGTSSDALEIESLGFVFKLGKVKEG